MTSGRETANTHKTRTNVIKSVMVGVQKSDDNHHKNTIKLQISPTLIISALTTRQRAALSLSPLARRTGSWWLIWR